MRIQKRNRIGDRARLIRIELFNSFLTSASNMCGREVSN